MRLTISAILAALALTGCESWEKTVRHSKSSWVGLRRSITLYACDGTPIGSWQGQFMVEVDSGVVSWIGDDGLERKVTGTIVIEELPQ